MRGLRTGSTSLCTVSTSLHTGSTSLRTGSTFLCTGSISLRTGSTSLHTGSTFFAHGQPSGGTVYGSGLPFSQTFGFTALIWDHNSFSTIDLLLCVVPPLWPGPTYWRLTNPVNVGRL